MDRRMETLHDAFAAARASAPQAAFLAESALSGGREWTFEEAGREVDRLAALYGRAGWGAGHRIALGVGNHPRHFFHLLALNRLGASIVPLNPDHRGAEIRYALGHSGARLAVCVGPRRDAVRDAIASDPALAALPVVDVDAIERELPAAPTPAAAPAAEGDAELAILYTSGTTGQPKGCVLTNAYALGAGAWYRDLGGRFDWRHGQDRLLNPLPVFHMNCGIVSLATAILTRNGLVVPDRFHAATWWEDCVRSRATAIHYLGIMPPSLFKQPPSDWERRHTIRFALGAGCDPTLHAAFEARFGFPLVEVWGMTETGRFLADHVEPRRVHTRAFGRPFPPLEARVVDDADRDVPDDAPGELVLRCAGPDPRRGFFREYLDDPEATATAWRGGWFHTGDVVTRDATGMLHFVDRRKDMVRRSGENISASEVEAVLAVHPSVMRVAVMPVPDDMRDEEVMAVVVPAEGAAPDAATAQALVRHCLAELAYYKAPGWVAFRASVPVTPTNKIQKNRIFAEGEDPRAAAIDCRAMKKRDAR
ncbi:MAG: AMP-binding protein [Burkholderiaceae bacterium]|nr:AMP-binding protein [Burkholderiales bacterium]MCZ8100216.1 AMP-binding protein [Burkholderiales bacterium]MCZ8341218.1 AMP-binding protein [Burkholderiaceae bacterium]